MQKKILSMLLVLVLLVTALPLTARAASSQWEWEGYTPISSYSELLAIGNNLSGKYYLTQDITASGTMSPIGSDSYPFTGILDGNGYTIRNLSISTYFYAPYAGRGVGLFARNSGIIRNLTLDNCTFDPTVNKSSNSTANYYGHLGLIAGYNTGEITNCVIGSGCTISPKIYASTVVGGITGYNTGTVKLCTNNAAITVYSKYNGDTEINSNGGITSSANFFYAGAIVGRGGTVYGCTNNGKLTCTGINDEEGIPGEVGGISSGSSSIAHCVNTGEIHVYTADYTYGTTVVGGIVGRAGGTVSDCESSGYIRVHGAMNYVGGIAGDTWDANLIRCARTGGNIRVDTKYYSDYGYGYIYFGGLVGNLVNSDITDSYTRAIYLYGYSDGYAYPRVIFGGGLVGTADGYSGSGGKNSTSSITNCYSLLDNFAYNTTQADSWCMAGLIGSSYGDVTTSYCYSPLWGKNSGSIFNMQAVYFSDGEGSFSYTRANPKGEMMNESFCVGFDFSNTWILGTGDYKYPVFRKAASHGHSLTPYSSIDHTCSSDGRIANWYCSGCQTYFRDSSAKFAISEDERTVMGGHSFTDKLSSSLAQAATCVAPAKYYLQCDNCTYISNSLTASSGDPNPNGHSFSGGTCSYCGIRGGQCGNTLYWTYADGKLTIYGSGSMYDYLYNSTAPWYTYRSGITSVEVASGVTSIGNYAFYNLRELTSVSLPEGLLEIGFRAFENADALAELTLPATVNTIGDNAFHGCTALESVNIPQGVSSILTGTFYGCSALKSVVLPDGMTAIGDSAFNGCTALEEIYVPASVTSVGFKPFEGCGALMDHYYGGTAESYKSMVSITSANVRVHGNCASIDSHWVLTDFPATCTRAGYTAEVDPCTAYERNRVVTGSANPRAHSFVEGTCEYCGILGGPCGDSAWWTLDDLGNLTVYGEGAMRSYRWSDAPWLEHAQNLKTLVVEEGIVSVSHNAFRGCTQLVSASLPETLETISNAAFANCSALVQINIPDSVTTLESAFMNCSSLATISIPEGITQLGSSSFSGCSSLTSVELPTTVTEIGEYAFSGCSSLASINLPDGVTSIGRFAFQDCSSLTTLDLPDSVTFIGAVAFDGCSALTEIVIPDGITTIDLDTFQDCTGMETLVIPASVTTINADAFLRCTPSEVYFGGTKAAWNFKHKPYATYVHYETTEPQGHWYDATREMTCTEDGYTCTACDCGYEINKVITDEAPGHDWIPSTCISPSTCSACGATSGNPVPSRHTYENYACKYCGVVFGGQCGDTAWWTLDGDGLLRVYGEGDMWDFAWNGRPWNGHDAHIQSIAVEEGITSIGENAFPHADNLASVTLADSIVSIGYEAFMSCDNLETIALPGNLETIGGAAFEYSGLKEIIIPDTVTVIGSSAFQGCGNLTEVRIPAGVTVLNDSTFRECPKLVSVELPAGLTAIGKGVFFDCFALESLTIPASVTAIGDLAFSDCRALEYLVFLGEPSFLTDDLFRSCWNMDDVYYAGTDEDWPELGKFFEGWATIYIHYCCTEPDGHWDSYTQDPSCTDDGYTAERCACGYERNKQMTQEAFDHSFTNYVSNGDATCTQDGTKTAQCDHDGCTAQDTLKDAGSKLDHFDSPQDADHICDTCDKVMGNCVDGNKDNVCDSCGATICEHEDTAKPWHICDKCERTVSGCTDEGKDHACDLCGERVGEHRAAEGKHTCDYCGEAVTTCADSDQDHKCDVCDKELEKSEDPTEPDPTEPDPTEPDPTEPDPTESQGRDVIRLAGDNRFATAFLVAEQMKEVLGKPRFDAFVLASGTNFADALSGSYLAAVKNAPILLGYKGEYNFQTILYIHANLEHGGTVYILGGEKAVSKEFDDAFQTLGIRYERLAGADRFETNLMVLREAGVKAGDEVLVCTGTDFADSLSGSATGLPILLTYKKLTDNQKAYLATLNSNSFCVVGGTSAVSDSLLKEVSQYGPTDRLAGDNRLLTSVLVAQRYFEDPDSAVIAYGWNFPDGLCGGPLAYAMKAPLILTHYKQKYFDIAAQYSRTQSIGWGYVLGGDGLVSNEAAVAIFRTGENLPVTMK